jgi:DNA-binding response OmpR family regulator
MVRPPVLVVDSEKGAAQLLRDAIAELDFAVVLTAERLDDARRRAETERFGLVVASWDGQPEPPDQLTAGLREIPGLAEARYIAVSSEAARQVAIAKALQLDGLLLRPYSLKTLRTVVDRALGQQRPLKARAA